MLLRQAELRRDADNAAEFEVELRLALEKRFESLFCNRHRGDGNHQLTNKFTAPLLTARLSG